MKTKNVFIILGLFFVLGTALADYKKTPAFSKLSVQSIDNKGIYVGESKSGLESPPDEESRFTRTVKALNEGWEWIGIGNSYYVSGQYEKAADAYKKAYEVDPGNRTFTGDKLIETYEKLGRHDEAIALVEEILRSQPLAEKGIKDFTEIRTRLLTAKNRN